MTTNNQTSNPLSLGKFGDMLFVRQTPMVEAETHKGAFATLSNRFNAWRERRAAATELANMSDRELADIGVSRQEIPQVILGKK